jgi:hypothetical protein
MKRLGEIKDTPPTAAATAKVAQLACDDYFGRQQLSQSNKDALNALFPALGRATSTMHLIAA